MNQKPNPNSSQGRLGGRRRERSGRFPPCDLQKTAIFRAGSRFLLMKSQPTHTSLPKGPYSLASIPHEFLPPLLLQNIMSPHAPTCPTALDTFLQPPLPLTFSLSFLFLTRVRQAAEDTSQCGCNALNYRQSEIGTAGQ